mgnify:CR=1 FL=1|jgi:hypothetical protein
MPRTAPVRPRAGSGVWGGATGRLAAPVAERALAVALAESGSQARFGPLLSVVRDAE